jgi:hypothetical protein
MSDDGDLSAFAPIPQPHPLKPTVDRSRGPFAQRGAAPKKSVSRKAPTRSTPPRGAADARADDIFGAGAPARMEREQGFNPDYDGPKERVSRVDRDTNQFELPAALQRKLVTAGWSWAFKVITVYNQPVDGTELLVAENAGWRAAKAKDFPELVPKGTSGDSPVERFGQRLYIRPASMTRQAQNEDYQFANAQMQNRMRANVEGARLGSENGNDPALSEMGRVVRPVHITFNREEEFGHVIPEG